jgi:hypothetical protein
LSVLHLSCLLGNYPFFYIHSVTDNAFLNSPLVALSGYYIINICLYICIYFIYNIYTSN